jgi:hypothetical protein
MSDWERGVESGCRHWAQLTEKKTGGNDEVRASRHRTRKPGVTQAVSYRYRLEFQTKESLVLSAAIVLLKCWERRDPNELEVVAFY